MLPPVDRTITYMYLMIEHSSVPIQGSVSVGGESARVFSGWIELAGVIEQARLGAAYRPAGLDSPGGGGGSKSLGSIPGVKKQLDL